MRKNKNIILTWMKVCILAIITNSIFFRSSAISQKLPSLQKISMRAPVNIKIDGKADEWSNKFQAYNNHTEFYYTICNDDNNLYLIVQSTIPEITNRITNGGISFTINLMDKRDDKGAIGIKYPVFDGREKGFVLLPVKTNKTITGDKQIINIDSIINVKNKRIIANAKSIKTYGLKNVDSLISVYNENGIRAAGLFDSKLVYSWEISISLNMLGLNINDMQRFAYHFKINSVTESGINQPNRDSADPLQRLRGIKVSGNAVMGQEATDFWGEYTLAKKP